MLKNKSKRFLFSFVETLYTLHEILFLFLIRILSLMVALSNRLYNVTTLALKTPNVSGTLFSKMRLLISI